MADLNIHRTDQDFLNGNLERSPRYRLNRTAALALTTAWQRIDFNGTSSLNVNTFPSVPGQAYQTMRWDATNKIFLFTETVDRNYTVSLFYHLVASGLLTNSSQMRFVIPNGVSPGVNLYFPFTDDGGYKDLCDFAGSQDRRVQDQATVYINDAVRTNGLGVEIKVASTLGALQSVSLATAAIIFFGR